MASSMVSANFTGSAVSRTTMGPSTWSRHCCAAFTPSAVCGSIITPRRSCRSRIVATRSACEEVPDAKPYFAAASGNVGSSARENPPSRTFTPNRSATRSASRPSRSKTKRSKFDAREISIDGLEVFSVSAELRTRYSPVRKNSSSTSFSFVATMRRSIGRPICLAMWPAQMSPKLPVGTEKLIFWSFDSVSFSQEEM